MFQTYYDFASSNGGKIAFDEPLELDNFSEKFKNILKTKPSIEFEAIGERKVIEDQVFWNKAGNLMSSATNLDKLK